ncbi:unnamed protein product [Blepharisma stoltei]|uniref:Peptidase M14 domain-containing protein n=1 Tax=Blepharisma stoltei TaxID=1481888 RepID=A0AAU9IPL9_9CILI|nr:unnamed protein product [Blepharisma stoltei]
MEEFDIQRSVLFSDEENSEEIGDVEAKLKEEIRDGKFSVNELLPPPNPLLPKTLMPSEPAFQAQKIPFIALEPFYGDEEQAEQGLSADRTAFPAPYPPETSLRSLFESQSIVYLRSKSIYDDSVDAGYFNANLCDIKCLILKKRSLETKGQRLYQNELLQAELPMYYQPADSTDNTLVFESRFECGNLAMAAKIGENEYNLLMSNDINSKGHTQWFFFRVENTKANMRVKFNIVNFAKADSLFNDGMRVLVYSCKYYERYEKGWTRGGEDIQYYPNGILKDPKKTKTYYNLSFTYQFKYTGDSVFFAYSLPYTYTQLQQMLDNYERDPARNKYFARKTLCRTIGGNNCDYLTITNKGTLEEIRNKRGVVLSARVHPGETVGSWMMHGVLDFLTSDDPEASALRDRYVFKVVPMLNPDGVINGNYRCGLVGADLNRRWKNPISVLHPTIFSLKRLIKSMAGNYDIELICDLHGHSRKKNVFIYGCNVPDSPQACKIFPFILSKLSPIFSYQYSRFGVQKSKESTMRVTMFKDLKIPQIYTMESSFCGADFGQYMGMHFTGQILAGIGRDLCRTLIVFGQNQPIIQSPVSKGKRQPMPLAKSRIKKGKLPEKTPKKAENKAMIEPFKLFGVDYDEILNEMMQKEDILHNGEDGEDSSGSDSDPSEDNLEIEELRNLVPLSYSAPTKKKEKNKKKINQPKTFTRRIPKQKCKKCGEEMQPGHQCKVQDAPPPPKKAPIGLRTYYNLAGKRVHDQATQTPLSLYPKAAKGITDEEPNRSTSPHALNASMENNL